jgi:DNA-binding GntR family transcriptional regulator
MTDSTLAEHLAARLRRDILRGTLSPGSPVKERDYAAELGVSRTPMREAIRILAQEGLLQLRPARSPVVANPTLKEVTDDLTVIIALETLSGQLACEAATDEEIAAISAIQERMERAFGKTDPLDLFEIDMSFHRAIAVASHNHALAETHGDYLSRLWRTRFLTARQRVNRERVVRQHMAILDALRDRDPERIVRKIDVHMQGFFDTLPQLFDDSGEARGAAEEDGAPGRDAAAG